MNSVIITAGGSSSRFKGINKLLYKINGKCVIHYTVDKFISLSFIDEIIIPANITIKNTLEDIFADYSKVKIVKGGDTRQESVYLGLQACNNCEYVIIHDGARPFISENIIINCFNNAKKYNASITAVKTTDTIKIVNNDGFISSTPDRKTLWNAQTPQIFKYSQLFDLHKKLRGKNYTDDALLFENSGLPVYITEGEYSNIKITTADDVKISDNVM